MSYALPYTVSVSHEPQDGQIEIRTSGVPRTWCKHCGGLYSCNDAGQPVEAWGRSTDCPKRKTR